MDRRFLKYFRKRTRLDRWTLETGSTEGIEQVVVIPALAESKTLFTVLEDLATAEKEIRAKTLIVCVVNNRPPGHAPAGDREDNRLTLERLRACRQQSTPRLGVIDAASPGKELGEREGVGSARKIGMDWGAFILCQNGHPQGALISLDADCRVSKEYLTAIRSFFSERKPWAAVVEYAHSLGTAPGEPENPNHRAILAYELFLRYHELGLMYAGSPYAFPTIGSTIVCTPESYVAVGGMRKKKAAEDFYFLQELAKTGKVEFITETVVVPSSRVSHRVPFGTGKSMSIFHAEKDRLYETYPCEVFEVLKRWLREVALHPEAPGETLLGTAGDLLPSLAEYLNGVRFPETWDRIRNQVRTAEQGVREFHRWFDALKTLRCIHFLRDHHYGTAPLFSSVDHLLACLEMESPSRLGSVSLTDTEAQGEFLLWLRRVMRAMRS